MVAGRRVLVVPVAVAAGWELLIDKKIVVVKEVKTIEAETGKKTVILVQGNQEGDTVMELDAVLEDTKENSVELEGSLLPDGDTETPAIEREEEVEVET